MRAETIADRIGGMVDFAVEEVLITAIRRSPAISKQRRIASRLRRLTPDMINELDSMLSKFVVWNHKETVSLLARTIPRKWFRMIQPAVVLVGERVDEEPPVPEVVPPTVIDVPPVAQGLAFTEPIVASRLTDAEWADWLARHVFPSPDTEMVTRIVYSPVAGENWQERITKLSQLVQPESVAAELVQGVSEGENIDQLRKRILPHVEGNVRSSAQRIARTESMRVANEASKESYNELGDMLAGQQIDEILDERTRPHHALRHGTVYWKASTGKTPLLQDMPVIPDEPNCRGTIVPVLTPPDEILDDPAIAAEFANLGGEAIPDPIEYQQWFSEVDPGRRMLAVGKGRYNEMKKILGDSRQPEWFDFVDSDGKLISRKKLTGESDQDREIRRAGVRVLVDQRRNLIQQISATGFVM